MATVAKTIYCIEDWASDAALLRLTSSKTVSKLIGCKLKDVGNFAILILSMNFIRLWSLSINTRELR